MVGQTISHYRILEKLGEGGMGIVYKAQDTKLERMVALKFLPPHLSASEQDKARFIQEAQAAAALNHPNVCSVIDISEHDGTMFIVMEFVDGQTLREKVRAVGAIHVTDHAKGGESSLPMKQAIDIGIQIADGLAAAHEKGIVHRDIKPENIMIRKDGICQIMDFGLAKLRATGSKITRLTKEGSTVGTVGYMSPEQVQGQDTDHRSDIFSFGVLFYELITGQLPFKGVHETALAYEIVNVDAAPMSSIKPEIDPSLDAIVLECIEKDINERAQSIKQISVDLKRYKRESSRQRVSRVTSARPVFQSTSNQSAAAYGQTDTVQSTPQNSTGMLPWIVAAIFFVIAAVAIGYILLQKPVPPPQLPVTRAHILPPPRTYFSVLVGGHIAVSPDGRIVAFVATDTTGADQLWVRHIESLAAIPLVGTNGASHPFWSPDGKTIGYFAGGKLKKIDANGGPTLTICDALDGRGGSWNQEGIIVFAPTQIEALYKVSAAGGVPSKITKLDSPAGERSHRWPHFLPDGRHYVYTTQTGPSGVGISDNDLIRIASLDSSVDTILMHGNSNIEYASGYVLFHRQGTLMAQPFDTARLSFTGDAVPIAEQLQYKANRSQALFSVSRNGVLIYQGGDEQIGKLAIFDRTGNRVSLLDMKYPRGGRFSHDGKRIAYQYSDNQSRNADIWLYEIDGGRSSRFTFDATPESAPVWSPRDDSIVFNSNRKGKFDLYIKSSNGTGTEELLLESDLDKFVTDWSLDGRYLAFSTFGSVNTKLDLWLLPLAGDRKPIPFLQTEFREGFGGFSPDARWLVYHSDETGPFEIYVRSLEGKAGKWQISINGGGWPQWSRDGKTIYFTSTDRKEMAASVRFVQSSIVVDSVRTLFDYESRGIIGNFTIVSADGQKFLVMVTELRQTRPPITIVVNWDEELKKQ